MYREFVTFIPNKKQATFSTGNMAHKRGYFQINELVRIHKGSYGFLSTLYGMK